MVAHVNWQVKFGPIRHMLEGNRDGVKHRGAPVEALNILARIRYSKTQLFAVLSRNFD